MPSSSRNQPAPPSDEDDTFADASSHPVVTMSPASLQELVKRKNTYAKKRLTMLENVLNSLDQRQASTFRDADRGLVDQHLKAAQLSIQAVTDVVDASNHVMSPEDIDTFLSLADEHTPRLLDLVARVNIVQDHVRHNTTMPPPLNQTVQAQSTSSKKIDKTFRPDPLDEDATPEIFDSWRSQFEVFIERNNLENASLKEQRLLVNMCLTPAMVKTLSRVCLGSEATSISQIITKLEQFILKSNSLMTRRYHFFNCVQNDTETARQYIVRFRGFGDYASLDGLSYNDLMACRLITGVRDEELRTQLLRLPKNDFETVHDFVLSWEASRSNATQTGPSDPTSQSVNKLSSYKSDKKKKFHNQMQSPGPSSQHHQVRSQAISGSNPCQYCGLSAHPSSGCPAKGQQCTFCKITGHYAKVCRKKRRAQARGRGHVGDVRILEEDDQSQALEVAAAWTDEEDDNAVSTIFSITTPAPIPSKPTPKLKASFTLSGKHVGHAWILPDTGAAVSVLPQSIASSWDILSYVAPTTIPLKLVDGSDVVCLGTITLSMAVQGSQIEVIFFVCPGVKTVVMSWHALLHLGVIPRRFPNITSADVNQVFQLQHLPVKDNIIASYPKVFNISSKLSCMNGKAMQIYLKDSIDWPNVRQSYKPRPIPVPLRQATKDELDSMVAKGIIRPVSSPTMFTSPLLVVPKKGAKVRLVVDYTELNRYVRRPVHPFPSVPEVRTMIPVSAKFFATLDALQGYWQIPLQKDSQLLTTFITPWGRFCYTRAPMGLASSGDEFCRRGDAAFKDIPGVIKVVDDLLVYASTMPQLEHTLHQVMKAAEVAGITLSPDKFNLGTSVNFIGLNITDNGIRPDPRHIQAISDFPVPNNRTDLRSFLGLVNQFGSFSKSIATLSKALRPLLSLTTEWQWNVEHNDAFNTLKKSLLQSPILQYFDPQRPTKLVTDASKLNGLGFALLQKHQDKWALVACGSRYITSTEANYAICELEALAIAWAINKCRIYLMGMPKFDVVTDHRPLVAIFNSSRLTQNDNPRLIRIMQQVVAYNFKVYWIPGRLHYIPDALSRAPIAVASIDDVAVDTEHAMPLDPSLTELLLHANRCPQYALFRKSLSTLTAAELKKLPISTHGCIRAYSSVWDRLSIDDKSGLILMDASKIFIPASYRRQILSLAHASHQGISLTKSRLQALYFWQGMSNDIVQLLQACDLCQKFKSSQPEQPLIGHAIPDAPFRAVSCDVFDYQGSYSLILVDRFSGYPLVAHFNKSPSSMQIIVALSSFFKDFGLPSTFRHDGATPFVSSQFKDFLKKFNITDQLSSAYYPKSNGHAEAAVKAVKMLVKKCWQHRQLDHISFNNAMLEWRNTPRHPANLSPAQLLFGRNLRTLLPAVQYQKVSHETIQQAVRKNYQYIKNAYESFNFRKNPLRPLAINDAVRIQDPISKLWDKRGVVTEVRPGGLSYRVTSQGRSYLRNRRFLKKCYDSVR